MGKIIAFEGIDGSGKGTHSALLFDHLVKQNFKCELISFPEYERHFFGREVGKYLNGDFGDIDVVDPKFSSVLYAGDRFESNEHIRTLLPKTDFIICDRYTPSNIAHQSAKVRKDQQLELQQWITTLEYSVFKIPEPDLVILLDIDPVISMNLIKKKKERNYTKKSHDIHEEDLNYLIRVRDIYLELSGRENWLVVNSVDKGVLRTIDDIQEEIWQKINREHRASFSKPGNTDSSAISVSLE